MSERCAYAMAPGNVRPLSALPYTLIGRILWTAFPALSTMGLHHFMESEMRIPSSTLVGLETKFWQSMVDQDTDVALNLLCEPALMVSPHGAMTFDHAGYRQMAEHGAMVVNSFEITDMEVLFPTDSTAILSYRVKQGVAPRGQQGATTEQEMNDTSTWVRTDRGWRCAMHTETPRIGALAKGAKAAARF